jgi:hypothetical protein
VTTIRHITQELDDFSNGLVTAMEHRYVDNRALADEITDSLRGHAAKPQAADPAEAEPVVALA